MNNNSKHSNYYFLVLDLIWLNEWLSHAPSIGGIYSSIGRYMVLIIAVLVMAVMVQTKANVNTWIITGILFVCAYLTYRNASSSWLMYLVFLSVFSKGIGYERLLSHIRKIMSIILIINVGFFTLRYLLLRTSLLVAVSRDMTRYSISFPSSSYAASFLVFWVMLRLLIQRGRTSHLQLLGEVMLTLAFYYLTRSEICLVVFAEIAFFKYVKEGRLARILPGLYKYCVPVFLGLSLAGVLLYHPSPFFNVLNYLTTGRIQASHDGYVVYGPSLVGQVVDFIRWVPWDDGTDHFICLDNTFLSIVINYGTVFLIPLIIVPFISNKYLDETEKAAWCVYSGMFFMVDGMLSPWFSTPVVLIVCKYFTRKREERRGLFIPIYDKRLTMVGSGIIRFHRIGHRRIKRRVV